MALLMEHGGLMFRVSESLLIENLSWVEAYFNSSSSERTAN